MKKLLAVLLALFMLLALVGCGSKSSSSDSSSTSGDTVELVWWAHQEEQWVNTYNKVIELFEAENPGIKVKLETFPYDEFESKVLTALSSKTGGADIYEMWGGWGVDYASTGALAALPDSIANEIVNDAYEPTYGSLYHEGKLYGLPLEFNIEYGGLLVNLNLLNQNGLKPAETWTDLVVQAKSLTKKGDNGLEQKGFDFCNLDSVTYLFTAMILQQGANYRNEDGTFNFTSDAAKKAFEELASLLTTNQVTEPGELVNAEIIGYNELFAGKTAYVPRGPWVIPTGTASEADGGFALELGKDFDYIALPIYAGTEAKFVAETGWSLAVNAKSEKQEAAFKFVDFLFRDDIASIINLGCGTIPAKKSVATSDAYLSLCPYAAPLVKILDKASYIGAFNTDNFKEIIANHLVDYTSNKYASVDECLKDMETECNAMVGK